MKRSRKYPLWKDTSSSLKYLKQPDVCCTSRSVLLCIFFFLCQCKSSVCLAENRSNLLPARASMAGSSIWNASKQRFWKLSIHWTVQVTPFTSFLAELKQTETSCSGTVELMNPSCLDLNVRLWTFCPPPQLLLPTCPLWFPPLPLPSLPLLLPR